MAATHFAARLVSAWTPRASGPPHQTLGKLLRAVEGADCTHDTLGERNLRLLRLLRAAGHGQLNACVRCTACGVENELTVPVEAILATPPPTADARVAFEDGDRTHVFRLPRMSDIEAASGLGSPAEIRAAVLKRCLVDGDAPELHDADAERLGGRFEALDPAANVIVHMACSGCGVALAAAVDIASLVAHEIDRVVERLYRDVHSIASAYGWHEEAILSLPAERRRRYVDIIALHPAAPRPQRMAHA